MSEPVPEDRRPPPARRRDVPDARPAEPPAARRERRRAGREDVAPPRRAGPSTPREEPSTPREEPTVRWEEPTADSDLVASVRRDEPPAGRRAEPSSRRDGASPRGGRRIETDSENVQRDLTKLVLTIVELVRQLVERQCIRRVDQGDLSDEQVEEIGVTLMRLEEAMADLCDRFGLSPSDLNLDLGPLGTLLPPDLPDA